MGGGREMVREERSADDGKLLNAVALQRKGVRL
jgi:hypothetical protein